MAKSIDIEARLVTGSEPGAWTYAVLPGSAEALGTRRSIRTVGTIDGEPVVVTLLPMGGGTHMLPVRAAVRERLGKRAGDQVRAQLRAGSEA